MTKQLRADIESALRALVHQRDYCAEHGVYDVATARPDPDQAFDDWAADIAETLLARLHTED